MGGVQGILVQSQEILPEQVAEVKQEAYTRTESAKQLLRAKVRTHATSYCRTQNSLRLPLALAGQGWRRQD
jgi:hypothetical protein